ncbi:dienelactone hydrolase family protein [Arthrobacter sp. 18067]|uniref:dienelactone hydrolase family protein n=1 Tax=Arthrobacter sp. 18067 TaxID=2681413 RepID=UPI001358D98B|nr:dienelactone hydrolase family protein [Arthrobacter sp. 18067]
MNTVREVRLTAFDGHRFRAYVASPATHAPAACVVLLHEIFGINAYMQTMAGEFADAGYIAVVPDLFARQEQDVDLGYTGPDFNHAIELRDNLDVDLALTDIAASLAWCRRTNGGNGRVATLGYCLGGGLAFITAATEKVDCAVSYYGVGIQDRIDLATSPTMSPLLLHFAEEDHYCPPDARMAIMESLAGTNETEIHLYEGVGHAFATYGRDTFDAESTRQAWTRTLAFLNRMMALAAPTLPAT